MALNLLQVELEGEFMEEPLHVLDRREVQLQKKTITQLKIQWKHYNPEETTWESEEVMKEKYPFLF